MKLNATKTSALKHRIASQKKQTLDLNKWIFEQIQINPTENVLELCCGTGAQTKYFSRIIKEGKLQCIELNSDTIDDNKKNIQDSRIEYCVSDIDEVSLYVNKFYDLIFTSYGFYYSQGPKALHQKLKDSLNKNGRFILVGPVLGNNKELYEILQNWLIWRVYI